MKPSQHWSSESGTSLVSVLVALALFAIVAVMSSVSFKNLNSSKRRTEASVAIRDLESVIVQTIVQRYKDYILNNRCVATQTAYFTTMTIGSLAQVTQKPILFRDKQGNPAAAPALAAADITRCTNTAFSTASPLNTSQSFYNCLNINTLATAANLASKDAFASNQGAFVEVYVKIRDLRTDAAVRCIDVIGKGYGLEVSYMLHWTLADPSGTIYDSKTGTLNVAL